MPTAMAAYNSIRENTHILLASDHRAAFQLRHYARKRHHQKSAVTLQLKTGKDFRINNRLSGI
jgi:hypothetical protein